jgi:hypothetical protein
MHLDRTNSTSKNDCENANTLAYDDETLVVLTPLRRRWSLSSREGLGSDHLVVLALFTHDACKAGFRRFRGIETPIFLYVNVEFWRRCHMLFHELKHVL